MKTKEELIRWAVCEAMDEHGIYDDQKFEKKFLNYASKLAKKPQFQDLNATYKQFLMSLIDFE